MLKIFLFVTFVTASKLQFLYTKAGIISLPQNLIVNLLVMIKDGRHDDVAWKTQEMAHR